MRKQHFGLAFCLLLISVCCLQLTAQEAKKNPSANVRYSEEFIHHARELYDWNAIEIALADRLHISQADCNNFLIYVYRQQLADLSGYLEMVKAGSITKSNANQYWINQFPAFEKLYQKEKLNVALATPSLISSPSLSQVARASCSNLDFTSGLSGWTGAYNDTKKEEYGTLPQNLPAQGLNTSGGTNGQKFVHEIMTTGNDPHVPISKVPPGHTTSLRLGDDAALGLAFPPYPFNHQMVRKTFTVSATNPTITYWYAVVFSQASPPFKPHDQTDQPYFKIRLFDKDGKEIKCASYDVDATAGANGGFLIKTLNGDDEAVYKDWVPVFIPLIDYVNQEVTIQFESSDCQVGGHMGYAYVAVDCAPFEAITTTPFICGNNTADLTAPAGSNSYEWTGPGVVPPNTTQKITVNKPGKYSVKMSVKGNNNVFCYYNLDTVITGSASLTVADFTSSVVCQGQPTTFTDGSTPTGTITSWSWDFNNDGVEDSNLQNPTYTFLNAGTFAVKLSVQVGPCSANITKNVIVNLKPDLKITNPPAVCEPNTVNFTDVLVTAGSTTGTGTILSYWQDANATAPLTNPNAVTISGTYYIKIVVDGGCTDIKPVIAVINPKPVSAAGTDVTICSGTTTASIGGPSTAGYTYEWAPPSGLTNATISNPGITTTNNGTTAITTNYILTTIITATGCRSTDDVNVTVNPQPLLSITDPRAVCVPTTIDLTSPAITINSTAILGGTLTYWQDAAATIALASPNAISTSGTYYIKVTMLGGCLDIKPVTVVVNPLPLSNAGPDVLICTGDVASIGTTAMADHTYSWTPATGLSSNVASNPTVTIANPGKNPIVSIYTVTTTNSLTGCSTTDEVEVAVNAVPTVKAGSVIAVCPGATVKLEGSIGGSATSATWSGGAGTFSDINNVVCVYTPTAAEYAAGSVKLTLTTNDPDGPCTFASSDVILTFYKNPVVNFTADKIAGCPVHCVNFSDSSNVEGAADVIEKWKWDFGDPASGSNTSNIAKPQHCYENTGFYDVKLTVTSSHGCVSTLIKPKMIQVFAIPVAEFFPSPNPASVFDTKITLTNGSSADVVYWNYHFGDGDSIAPNVASPVHIYPNVNAGASYVATLDVRNADGCVNRIEHLIEIAPEFTFFIPNAFTPDGDGDNDFFFGKGIGIIKYDMVILDRWGNLLFHAQDLNDKWNGKANGGEDIAQQDVYVWKVKLTDVFNKKHSYIGTVTLLK